MERDAGISIASLGTGFFLSGYASAFNSAELPTGFNLGHAVMLFRLKYDTGSTKSSFLFDLEAGLFYIRLSDQSLWQQI